MGQVKYMDNRIRMNAARTLGQLATSSALVRVERRSLCNEYNSPCPSLPNESILLCAKSKICCKALSINNPTSRGMTGSEHTLKRLALVPMMNPAWSNALTHAVSLSGTPFFKCVPTYDKFIIADKFGSHEPNSNGVISYTTGSGASSVVRLLPTGLESAMMRGNGVWCCA